MKVLSISNCPLNESQGSGYIIVNFAKYLRLRGHEVTLISPEECDAFGFVRGARRYRLALGMFWRAWRDSRLARFDVIEFYGGEAWLAISLLRLRPGRRFLLVSHSNGLEAHWSERQIRFFGSPAWDGSPLKWYQKLFRMPTEKAAMKADGLVTVSENDRRFAVEKKYRPDSRVTAIENSLPPEFLGLQVSYERPRSIGFCGSWLANKGTSVMLSDLPGVLRDFPDATLTLIGVGDQFRKEEKFPAELCSRIHVIPFVADKAELRSLYQKLSIVLVPSIYESFSLVAAEAMACGCGVIATKTGFPATLKSGEEVWLLPEPISPALGEALQALLTDDAARRRIAAGGYARVQSLSWPEAAARLDEVWNRWRSERGFSA
jgi:glycosyltransferase involved in cell wall biosynthesis